MAIEDVIHDLNVYFDSIRSPVELKATMGGIVNPSYLTIRHKGREQVLQFWSVAGGSNKEKELAQAFKADIEEFINAQHQPIPSETDGSSSPRPGICEESGHSAKRRTRVQPGRQRHGH